MQKRKQNNEAKDRQTTRVSTRGGCSPAAKKKRSREEGKATKDGAKGRLVSPTPMEGTPRAGSGPDPDGNSRKLNEFRNRELLLRAPARFLARSLAGTLALPGDESGEEDPGFNGRSEDSPSEETRRRIGPGD